MSSQRISLDGQWLFRLDAHDAGVRERWHHGPVDATAWATLRIPCWWEFHGRDGDEGIGWYRREFELPAGRTIDATKSVVGGHFGLCLAGIDNTATVWINGVELASESPNAYRFAAGSRNTSTQP